MDQAKKGFMKKVIGSLVVLIALLAVITTVFCNTVFAQEAHQAKEVAATTAQPAMTGSDKADIAKFGLLAAAIALGLGAIGAGMAISHVGAAAMGAIAEKPQVAGQALIFVALAEGLVIFGFITALMILGKV
jgi:V/A-type H+/Na+-transporting ATPase subunit K